MNKSILVSMSATALLMVASPAIEAEQETNPSQNNNHGTEQFQQAQEEGNIKEVYTYKEFKNAKGPVSINPNLLSDKELKSLNLNPEKVKSDAGNGTSFRAAKTRKWSSKVTKDQLAGASATVGGVITIISGILSWGSGATITSGAFSVFSQVIRGGKWKGVKFGGTKTKRLVRENPYQLPKKKWVHKITWAKPY